MENKWMEVKVPCSPVKKKSLKVSQIVIFLRKAPGCQLMGSGYLVVTPIMWSSAIG